MLPHFIFPALLYHAIGPQHDRHNVNVTTLTQCNHHLASRCLTLSCFYSSCLKATVGSEAVAGSEAEAGSGSEAAGSDAEAGLGSDAEVGSGSPAVMSVDCTFTSCNGTSVPACGWDWGYQYI